MKKQIYLLIFVCLLVVPLVSAAHLGVNYDTNESDGFSVNNYVIPTGSLHGITSNETDFWIAQDADNGHASDPPDLVNHTDSTGAIIATGSFDTEEDQGGAEGLLGITSNGTDFWLPDNPDDFIYHFDYNGVNMSDGFSTASLGITAPTGIATNGSDFWLLDTTDKFIYHLNPAYANQSDGFSIAGIGVTNALDLDMNNTDFWIQDGSDDFIYHVNRVGTNMSDGFSTLAFGSDNPVGVAVSANGTDVWLLDGTDNFIYHISSTFLHHIENSTIYNANTVETKPETFRINITYDPTLYSDVSGILVHNGSTYLGNKLGSGASLEFNKLIYIPSLTTAASENMEFYWEFTFTTSNGTVKANSTFINQTVSPLIFQNCNATFTTPIVVNFSIYHETNRSLINTSFEGTFEYALENSSITKTFYYTSSIDNSSFKFCTNSNDTYIVDSTIKISKETYTDRTFFLRGEEYNNLTTQKNLYLLNNTEGSSIIIEVKDSGLQPLEDYIVSIERYYPGINEYIEVVSEKTDEFGQFVARLIEDTVKYRFTFRNETNDVVKTTNDVAIICKAVFCTIPFVIENTANDFAEFTNVTDFEYSLSFNNETNRFTYSWNDITGNVVTFRLLVQRITFNETRTICDVNSIDPSSSLICNVGSDAASYRASAFREEAGDERRISVLNVKVGESFGIFWLEGVIWTFLLLFTLIAVGVFNPSLAIILYLVGYIGLGVLGIISFSIPVLIAQLVLGIIFIWAFRR